MTTVSALIESGLARPEDAPDLERVAARYAVAITPDMARLIDRGDGRDPIARQFVPTAAELIEAPLERADPIGDFAHEAAPGVVHRYSDRALLKVVHACPVYCRFCFRREMVGPGGEALTGAKLDAALAYVAAHPRIWEVILTGGDPFMLSPRRAAEVTARLSAIPHVKVLRWHTRVPVVEPARVTDAFATAIGETDRALVVGVHANHPRELTHEARAALKRLARAGAMLVSQTVLLKGVNDDAATLAALMRGFVEAGVKPYYLHHADLAPGTSHFRTTIAEGQALMRALHAQISGVAMPTYVLDIPGGVSKAPVGPAYLRDGGDGLEIVGDDGVWRDYPEP